MSKCGWIEENKYRPTVRCEPGAYVVDANALREQVEKLAEKWRLSGMNFCASDLESTFLGKE